MSASGYALQISSVAMLSRVALVIHLASSGLFLVSYVTHQVLTFKIWRAKARLESRRVVVQA
jgi:hypothetical protein